MPKNIHDSQNDEHQGAGREKKVKRRMKTRVIGVSLWEFFGHAHSLCYFKSYGMLLQVLRKCRRLRIAEMDGIAEVLQLPVIIDGERAPSFEPERLQEIDFLSGGIAAQGFIPKKLSEAGFHRNGRLRFLFHKLESPELSRSHSAVKPDFHIERIQIDVPVLNQKIEER